MTSEQKKALYTLLQKVSDYTAGYSSPLFDQDITFEDDFVEVLETKPAAKTDGALHSESAKPSAPKISSAATLESVNAKIASCTKCLLNQKRLNPVFGEGVINPLVMVIGEVPGEEDDKTGRTSIGKAGELLDKMLSAINLRRDLNCYITNIVKCRPPFNRSPMEDEAQACSGFLEAQIHILKPKIILAMGRCVLQNLLKTSQGLNSLRGKFFEYNGIPVLGTYHPEDLLREPALKAPAWADLKAFRARLETIKPGYEQDFKALQREALR